MERRNDIPNLLAMYIRNTSNIYNITSWLQSCVIKKQPQLEYLAKCSAMKTIIREAARLLCPYKSIKDAIQDGGYSVWCNEKIKKAFSFGNGTKKEIHSLPFNEQITHIQLIKPLQ